MKGVWRCVGESIHARSLHNDNWQVQRPGPQSGRNAIDPVANIILVYACAIKSRTYINPVYMHTNQHALCQCRAGRVELTAMRIHHPTKGLAAGPPAAAVRLACRGGSGSAVPGFTVGRAARSYRPDRPRPSRTTVRNAIMAWLSTVYHPTPGRTVLNLRTCTNGVRTVEFNGTPLL